jgi:NADH-quinone oxidoreductase subunit E
MTASISEIFKQYNGTENEVIPILQDIQKKFGYLSTESLLSLSAFTRIPEAKIYGIATFYAQFRFQPIGKKHITVCRGTACHVNGAPFLLEEIKRQLEIDDGETTPDGEYSLETVACIGCCSLSPCITVNGKVMANMTPKKVASFFSKGVEA